MAGATDWTLMGGADYVRAQLYDYNIGHWCRKAGVYWWTDTSSGDGYYYLESMYSDTILDRVSGVEEHYCRPWRAETIAGAQIYNLRDRGPGNGLVFNVEDLGGSFKYSEVATRDISLSSQPWCETLAFQYDSTGPDTPSITSVTAGPESLKVVWGLDEGTVSYTVWYSTTNSSATATQQGGTIHGSEYTIVGLTASTLYYVWVQGMNEVIESAFSTGSSGTPTAAVAPSDVMSLYTSAFTDYGSAVNLRKYPLNEEWGGPTPLRGQLLWSASDDPVNHYPIDNMVSTTQNCFIDTIVATAYSDTREVQVDLDYSLDSYDYSTIIRGGVEQRVCYVPYTAANKIFLSQNLLQGGVTYGKDVILFQSEDEWFWAAYITPMKFNDEIIYYELKGPVVGTRVWPFETSYDRRGAMKEIVVYSYDEEALNYRVDLDS